MAPNAEQWLAKVPGPARVGLDWVGLSGIFALGNIPGKLALLGADSQAAYDGYYQTQRGLMNSIGSDLAQAGLGAYGMSALPGLGALTLRGLRAIGAARGAVNIDTGTAVAFVSEGSPVRHALKAFVKGKDMVMTETALREFQTVLRVAGPQEAARALRFLERVSIVPDNPSLRALVLKVTRKVGANDIRIFGTGDYLGIPTMTSDAKFLRGATLQGVDFAAFLHSSVPLTGF